MKKTLALAGMALTAVPTAVFILCFKTFFEKEERRPYPGDRNRWWFGV